MHPRKIILNGHATFVLVRRGYHTLSYSILKLNQEYERRLCKVGHCLQKSFSCSSVGGHYFDYCQVLVIARTMSYIITLTMNVSNIIYSITASYSSKSDCFNSNSTCLQEEYNKIKAENIEECVCKANIDRQIDIVQKRSIQSTDLSESIMYILTCM